MSEHEKKRATASEVLVALRKAMGKTQQTFAVEVLKGSIGTVARYETADPPTGGILLRLRDVAREQGLNEIANRFELLYRQEVQKALHSNLTIVPATGASPTHGHLAISLPSELAVAGAQDFVTLVAQLDSPDSKIRRSAKAAFSSLRRAARRFENPAVGEIQDAFRAAFRGAQTPMVSTTKTQPKKRRQKTT